MTSTLVIKPEREKPVINQHPWVFSGAVEKINGNPQPGEMVTLVNRKGNFLGRGYYNAKSQIVVRILTWHDEAIDEAWWRAQLQRAIEMRRQFKAQTPSTACRLINAENDYLSGLVVDSYGEWLVMQALTLGIDQRKTMLARLLGEITGARGVYERSDVDVRGKEGLKDSNGLLWGEEPPEHIAITEGSAQILVDVRRGHKTGFYLDQRDNRDLLRQMIAGQPADQRTVLNLFSYTGGFGVKALEAGATGVVNVDSSRDVLELAEKVVKLNQPNLPENTVQYVQANVFDYLRDIRDSGQQFDIIVCDPPKFAQNAKQVESAARGYKDLNLNAFYAVKPGGYLLTFSCSGAITRDLFQKIVFGALADTRRQAQILRHLSAGADHPVALTFPEGEYLKGLLLRVY